MAGKLDLRTLATSSLFEADVVRAFDRLGQWRREVGEAEFERQAAAASKRMTALRRSLDQEKPEGQPS